MISGVGILVSIFGAFYSAGSARQELRETKERLADHDKRFDDHDDQFAEHTTQLAVHAVDIAKLAAWRDGYNAAAHAMGKQP
jgi:hypothetical protein